MFPGRGTSQSKYPEGEVWQVQRAERRSLWLEQRDGTGQIGWQGTALFAVTGGEGCYSEHNRDHRCLYRVGPQSSHFAKIPLAAVLLIDWRSRGGPRR